MKRTTYIIIGMLVAGLLALCGGTYCIYTIYNNTQETKTIAGEMKTIELPDCKVLEMVATKDIFKKEDNKISYSKVSTFRSSPLRVVPAELEQGSFTYPSDLDEYMTMKQNGDTLRIAFNFFDGDNNEKAKMMVAVESDRMTIELPSNVKCFKNTLEDQYVEFENFTSDSLSLSVKRKGAILNCNIRALQVRGKASWEFKSGKASNLHILLDEVYGWSVTDPNFTADTAYLYSSRYKTFDHSAWKFREVIWKPLSKKASLNVKLTNGAKIIHE